MKNIEKRLKDLEAKTESGERSKGLIAILGFIFAICLFLKGCFP